MTRLRRALAVAAFGALLTLATGTVAWAGSPHFIDSATTVTRSGDTLTVSAKEAGLGDEAQIVVTVSADAACLNPGQNFPQADNKQTSSATVTVPVQNGRADYTVTLTFVVQPRCNPPMSLVIGDVTVTDTTNGLTLAIPGTF